MKIKEIKNDAVCNYFITKKIIFNNSITKKFIKFLAGENTLQILEDINFFKITKENIYTIKGKILQNECIFITRKKDETRNLNELVKNIRGYNENTH